MPRAAAADSTTPAATLAVGFVSSSATPKPTFADQQGVLRLGAGFAALPGGQGALLYGGQRSNDDSTPTAFGDTWTWDGEHWTARCGTAQGGVPDCGPGTRALPGIALGPNGIVLFGGTHTGLGDDHAEFLDDTWMWDGATWKKLCDACGPRGRIGPMLAGNGHEILLFGGVSGPGDLPNDTWRFDGQTWTQLDAGGASAPSPRIAGGLTWDGGHFVLFGGGGLPGDSETPVATDDTWLWSGDHWSRVCGGDGPSCGPSARLLAAFAFLDSGDPARRGALLAGGMRFQPRPDGQGDDGEQLADLWFWSGSHWTELAAPWAMAKVMPSAGEIVAPVVPVAAASPADCRIDLVAPFAIAVADQDPGFDVETFSIGFDADGDGSPDPCPPVASISAPVVALAFEQGTSGAGPRFYDGTGFRTFAGFAPEPGGDRAVLYGGVFLSDADRIAEADTWTWDGKSWTVRCGGSGSGDASAPCPPGPRFGHGLAVGPQGTILYGGTSEINQGTGVPAGRSDAFLWKDGAWSQLCDDCPPGPRLGAALAGDGSEVVLFGGLSQGALHNDTWRFDGTTWSLLDGGGTGAPEPRFGAQIAWDGERFVLFSGLGIDANGNPVASIDADTWILEGTSWTKACGGDAPCGPLARAFSPLSFLASPDPDLRGALLVGGTDWHDFSPLTDVWLWNRARWARLASPWTQTVFGDQAGARQVVFAGAASSRPAACDVALRAELATFDGDQMTGLADRTLEIGFDRDGDGAVDACPAATPTPVPTSEPTSRPTPRPTPSALPTGRRSLQLGGSCPPGSRSPLCLGSLRGAR